MLLDVVVPYSHLLGDLKFSVFTVEVMKSWVFEVTSLASTLWCVSTFFLVVFAVTLSSDIEVGVGEVILYMKLQAENAKDRVVMKKSTYQLEIENASSIAFMKGRESTEEKMKELESVLAQMKTQLKESKKLNVSLEKQVKGLKKSNVQLSSVTVSSNGKKEEQEHFDHEKMVEYCKNLRSCRQKSDARVAELMNELSSVRSTAESALLRLGAIADNSAKEVDRLESELASYVDLRRENKMLQKRVLQLSKQGNATAADATLKASPTADDWVQGVCPKTGREYWYSATLDESTYENPQQAVSNEEEEKKGEEMKAEELRRQSLESEGRREKRILIAKEARDAALEEVIRIANKLGRGSPIHEITGEAEKEERAKKRSPAAACKKTLNMDTKRKDEMECEAQPSNSASQKSSWANKLFYKGGKKKATMGIVTKFQKREEGKVDDGNFCNSPATLRRRSAVAERDRAMDEFKTFAAKLGRKATPVPPAAKPHFVYDKR
eukprot:g758.t1